MATPILKEVRDYLGEHGTRYTTFQGELESRLESLKNHPEWSNVVYRIYSRADKQLGEKFKRPGKIAEKLEEWRKTNPSASVSAVHDIIALTAVVTFPSDVVRFSEYLKEEYQKSDKPEGFWVFNGELKEEEGYYAYHFKGSSGSRMGHFRG
jgi:ppGpp synthetase/RelA/SpoT-type nucleotidyltranferase